MVFASLLNHVFTVTRRTRTSDGQGGFTIGYAAAGTVNGRMRPASSNEKEVASAMQRNISHVLYVEVDADIERGDRVTFDGLSVDVLAIREPSLMGHHLEIDCLEVQKETHS